MNLNEGNKYTIVVACPFKSLVSQYKKKITEESGLNNICFDYRDLEAPKLSKKDFTAFHNFPIQLVTINSILGNPGQIAMKQSNLKREYYESLIKFCSRNDRKVILIFDEIHEAIHNFDEEYVFNLFKWRNVVHKIIVSSATFTEASKVVIKYFSELTEKRLKIFESQWIPVENARLSKLNLCLYNSYTYEAGDKVINDLIESQLNNSNKIHILTYSKKLAKDLYNSELKKKISERFGNVNLCVGDNSNSFEPDSCNIGTTFKTGVSIEDNNCSFFIIMPPNIAYSSGKSNSFGIFSSGIFNITQALARPRKESKIFVIMPSPTKIILTPIPPPDYINKTSLGYLPFNKPDYQAEYVNINRQDSLLRVFHNQLKLNVQEEINYVESSNLQIAPRFPEFDMYKLSKGEKYFSIVLRYFW